MKIWLRLSYFIFNEIYVLPVSLKQLKMINTHLSNYQMTLRNSQSSFNQWIIETISFLYFAWARKISNPWNPYPIVKYMIVISSNEEYLNYLCKWVKVRNIWQTSYLRCNIRIRDHYVDMHHRGSYFCNSPIWCSQIIQARES